MENERKFIRKRLENVIDIFVNNKMKNEKKKMLNLVNLIDDNVSMCT